MGLSKDICFWLIFLAWEFNIIVKVSHNQNKNFDMRQEWVIDLCNGENLAIFQNKTLVRLHNKQNINNVK